jgi:uncharacterized membrane protein YedE/YeeE
MSLQVYNFTPLPALLGGALLGTATILKMVLKGDVLGISGAVKGLLTSTGVREVGRWCFLAGLVAGGAAVAHWHPAAFGLVSMSNARAILGGFAVGLGAAIGNGCTSGHGICGNARLSQRSLVYTMTFMAAGFTTATLFTSRDAIRVYAAGAPSGLPIIPLAATVLAVHLALYAAAVYGLPKKAAVPVTDVLDGTLFAFGLGISGMTNPAKVVAFLDIHGGLWDPTLMLVMGSALALVSPPMLALVLPHRITAPCFGGKFNIPTSTVIDTRLLVGGVLFGIGWGISGMCPGPALVNIANPHTIPVAYLLSMLAGLAVAPQAPASPESPPLTSPQLP